MVAWRRKAFYPKRLWVLQGRIESRKIKRPFFLFGILPRSTEPIQMRAAQAYVLAATDK
jgi:hypothetical protein